MEDIGSVCERSYSPMDMETCDSNIQLNFELGSIEYSLDLQNEDKYIDILSDLLDQCLDQDSDNQGMNLYPTKFDGDCVDFSPSYYLSRIVKYSGASPCCIIAGFQYLERLKARPVPIVLSSRNLQRLLLTSVMTAAKFLEDQRPPLSCWCDLVKFNSAKSDNSETILLCRAEIGGLSVSELKSLEIAFLFEIDFNLGLSIEDYGRITEDLLLFATLRAATLEPWRLASLEESAMNVDTELIRSHSSPDVASNDPNDAGRQRRSAGIRDPTPNSSDLQPGVAMNPFAPAMVAASAAAPPLPGGVCLKRDRAPSPPPGPASPERPWTMRRADGTGIPQEGEAAAGDQAEA